MPFASTNVIDFSYDSMQNKLTVHFLGGGKHEFYNVEYEKYSAMLQAKSKGKFFSEHINEKYKSKKIY